jgi:hypothetical protein
MYEGVVVVCSEENVLTALGGLVVKEELRVQRKELDLSKTSY